MDIYKVIKKCQVNVYALCKLSKKELKSWPSYLRLTQISKTIKTYFWYKFLIVVQEDAAGSLADLGTQVKLLK